VSGIAAAVRFLKKEIAELIPPTIFFFVVFELVVVIRSLLGSGLDVSMTTAGAAFLGALIVGKSILIIDATPMFRWFSQPRLIVNVLWRTLLYVALALVFQLIEELIPLIPEKGSWAAAVSSYRGEVNWTIFWATHLFLVVFVSLYSLITALITLIGEDRAIEALFSGSRGRG